MTKKEFIVKYNEFITNLILIYDFQIPYKDNEKAKKAIIILYKEEYVNFDKKFGNYSLREIFEIEEIVYLSSDPSIGVKILLKIKEA